MLNPATWVDGWLFGSATEEHARRTERASRALALVIAARVATGPFRELAGQPEALFRPPDLFTGFERMPSAGFFVTMQIVGTVSALVASLRPNRVALPVAWLSLLVLAGLRGSLGKILHNDVLLVLAAIPFVLHALTPRRPSHAPWAARSALIVICAAYFFSGYQKLIGSGLEWVASDNFRWILYGGAASGRAPTEFVALFIADRPALAVLSAGLLLTLELTFPVVLFSQRLRRPYGVAAIVMHAGTWLTLGLDYWGWMAIDAIVLLYATAPRTDNLERAPAAVSSTMMTT